LENYTQRNKSFFNAERRALLSRTEIDKILDRALSGWPIKGEEAQKLLRVKEDDLQELLLVAREMAYEKYDKTILFYQKAFPPISLTGLSCSLNCKHCNKYYLRHMIPAKNPKKLFKVCKALYEKGLSGVLFSGGSRKDGIVPLSEFADVMAKIKKETGLIFLAHTGPINYETAKVLKESGLDGALIDVVGSEETTKKVFGIKIGFEDYMETFKALAKAGIPNISPHICIGLHFGRLKGEAKALELISEIKASTIVIVVLIPTRGTAMADVPPPSPTDVAKVVAIANLMFPHVPVSLGCVRPGRIYRPKIDEMAIRAGVGSLAVPTESSFKVARRWGFKTRSYDKPMCCCLRNFDKI
jgi:hypothetical protein